MNRQIQDDALYNDRWEKEEKKKLKEENVRLVKNLAEYKNEITDLKEENKKLKESLDIATKCSCKEEDGIIRLSEENKKLKENIEHTIKFNNECIGKLKIENEKLKEKIAKLEFDIEAWKKWKKELGI